MLLHNRKEWFKAVLNHDLLNVEESLSVYKKSRDGGGETALMAAARTNDAAMVKLLIHEEARMTSPEGQTALMIAAARDFYEVCAILGPYEADVRNPEGRTALMIAAIAGSTEAIKAIIKESEVDKDNGGLTALDHAVLNSELEAVTILCSHLKFTQEDFRAALNRALDAGEEDIARHLQSVLSKLVEQQSKPRVHFSADSGSDSPHASLEQCPNCKGYCAQIAKLREEVATLKQDNSKLVAKVGMLDTQLHETQQYDKEHQASLTNKCNALEDELNKLHEKYRVSLEENSRIKLELAKSSSTYERKKDAEMIEQLQQRLATKSNECASLQEQLLEAQRQRELDRQRRDMDSRGEKVMNKGPAPSNSGPGYGHFKYEFDVDKDSLMPSLLPPQNTATVRRQMRSSSVGLDSRNLSASRVSSLAPSTRTSSTRVSSRVADSRGPDMSKRPPSVSKRPDSTITPTRRSGSARGQNTFAKGPGGMLNSQTSTSPGIAYRSVSQRPRTAAGSMYATASNQHDHRNVSTSRSRNTTGPVDVSSVGIDSRQGSHVLNPLPSPIRKKGTLGSMTRFMNHIDATMALEARSKPAPVQPQYEMGTRKTDLMIAAESNDIVSVWHQMSTQAGLRDQNGNTALMYAVQAGNSAVARVLAEKEGGMQRHDGSTALMDAACIGNVECVRALLTREAGMQRYDGWTALMTASSNNKPEIVQLLLDREAGLATNSKFTAGSGLTALMAASIEGHLEVVHLLVHMENSMRHSSGKTAADFAKSGAIINLLNRF